MKTLECSTLISFKNILFLADLTPASEAAFRYALAFARHFGARLYPAHAVPPFLPTKLEAPAMPDILRKMEQTKRAKLVELAKSERVPNTVLITQEAIEDAVPHWINEHGIDLIVMGTHGRKGVERMFLGSTAEAVVRTATCPVLTIGPGVRPEFAEGANLKRILFATSLRKENDPAAAYALSFCRERGAVLTVLHMMSIPAETHEHWEKLAEFACDGMRELVPISEGDPVQTDFVVEGGAEANGILEYANKLQAGLIVLGLSRKTKTSTHFRRGVAYRVISSALCPVLTVH